MSSQQSRDGFPLSRLVKLMFALWLLGVAMRMTILAVPPIIPQVHAELHLSETQVGLLVGLPLALFAIAAVPGSLLIARIGARAAVIAGMIIAAVAGAARGAAIDVWTLYAAAIATGFGVAIMQPGLPTLVREWLPSRIGLGTIAYTSGMLMGAMFATILTIPWVLPMAGNSWRLDLVLWGVPAILIVPVFYLLTPSQDRQASADGAGGRWWPDWTDPLVWLLGLALGANNSAYFSTNAFLGDYLASLGKPELLASSLGWLNGLQIVTPFILIFMAEKVQRQTWPFLIFGPILLVSFLALMIVPTQAVIMVSASLVGLTTAITLIATLTLPPLLSGSADLPRTAAGMFTVSYATAILVPTVSGALWDATGISWTAFAPLCLCAAMLTVLGTVVARYTPRSQVAAAS